MRALRRCTGPCTGQQCLGTGWGKLESRRMASRRATGIRIRIQKRRVEVSGRKGSGRAEGEDGAGRTQQMSETHHT